MLFQGFTATALRDAPYAGVFLVVYEGFKQRLGDCALLIPRRPRYRTCRSPILVQFGRSVNYALIRSADSPIIPYRDWGGWRRERSSNRVSMSPLVCASSRHAITDFLFCSHFAQVTSLHRRVSGAQR